MIRAVAIAAVALLAQGCAAIPVAVAVGAMGAVPGDASPGDTSERAPDDGLAVDLPSAAAPRGLPRLEALPAQTLSPGACALFLFTRTEPSRFVAFAAADGAALTLAPDGTVQTWPAAAPLAPDPDRFEQSYRGAGLQARLGASLGEPLPQGRRAPDAVLRLETADGAAQITPLSGLIACESE